MSDQRISKKARALLVACNRDIGGREAMTAYIVEMEAAIGEIYEKVIYVDHEDALFACRAIARIARRFISAHQESPT